MNIQKLRNDMIVLQNTVDTLEGSRELSLVKTSLQKAMMWSGTFLKFSKLGENPYAKNDGKRETVKDIQPMFDDTALTLPDEIIAKGRIATLDAMRESLTIKIDNIANYEIPDELMETFSEVQEFHCSVALLNIYTNLTESKMWMGMEFGRLKREADKN